MSSFAITYEAPAPAGSRWLVPGGLATPDACCTDVSLENGTLAPISEARTGQTTWIATLDAPKLSLRFSFTDGAAYPGTLFRAHPSRYTRAAAELIDEVAQIAPNAAPLERATAIACATAERFTYGHPQAKFNDGMDEIPALGCGMTEGSCVDINTYFIASLRAAGIEAGYATGFFFPREKGDHCEDGHCWVVTRIDGQTHEWDIAHHLKLGTREIAPALNPKPGFRAALFHSMGLEFSQLGITEHKALIEPLMIGDTDLIRADAPTIRLHRETAP